MAHITVLKDEAVAALPVERAGTIVDCTYGSGGHSAAILAKLPPSGRLVSLDADPAAIAAKPATDPRHSLVCANFSELASVLDTTQIDYVDGILADLGWRSEQFSGGGRGFSFNADEPLLMTFGDPDKHTFTAYDVVNTWEESNLADVLYGYGEERAARRIARAVVAARAIAPITTAAQLASIVSDAVPAFRRRGRLHPATQTFQAIRIAVNDELGVLATLLNAGIERLKPTGRFAIISFHSLEDRLVKRTFTQFAHDQMARWVIKKPVVPSVAELAANPRARSAKLRVIEKL